MTDWEDKLTAVNLDLHRGMKHAYETIKGVLPLLPDGDARNALEAEADLILATVLGAIATATEGDGPFGKLGKRFGKQGEKLNDGK